MEQVNAVRIDKVDVHRVSVSVKKEGEVVYLRIMDLTEGTDFLYTMTVVDWERLTTD